MKILKVSTAYYPFLHRGGRGSKIKALADRLSERGHEVTVLTSDLGEDPAKAVDGPAPEAIYLPVVLRYRGNVITRGGWKFCRDRLHDFDVVHIYGTYDLLGPTAAYRAARAGVPYVFEPMGMYRPVAFSVRKKRLYQRVIGSRVEANAATVIATSLQEKEKLIGEGVDPSRIEIRRNGVDVGSWSGVKGEFRRSLRISPETPVVLFLGRITRIKNTHMLVDAFARAGVNGARLVIAGPDHDGLVSDLRQRVAALKIADKVFFPGPLYGSAKAAALEEADLLVLPSDEESFGNAAGEAIVCGTGVIVTNTCGIADLLRDTGGAVLINPDVNALANALREVLCDGGGRLAELAAGARKAAPLLSWDEPVLQMEAIYERVKED